MEEKTPVSCDFCYKHRKLYVWDSIGENHICNECFKKERGLLN